MAAREKKRRSDRSKDRPRGSDKKARSATGSPKAPPAAPSDSAAEVPPSERRRATNARRTEVNQRLALELRALRAGLREMMDRFEVRVGGQLADLEQLAQGESEIGLSRPFHTRTATSMLEEIGSARLKPRKGRAKDFGRLEALVERLAAHVPADR